MGLLKLFRDFGRRRRMSHASLEIRSAKEGGRICRFEEVEPRQLLSTASLPIHTGVVHAIHFGGVSTIGFSEILMPEVLAQAAPPGRTPPPPPFAQIPPLQSASLPLIQEPFVQGISTGLGSFPLDWGGVGLSADYTWHLSVMVTEQLRSEFGGLAGAG